MDFLMKAYEWLSSPSGVALFAALWGVSEFLGSFPKVKANGVFTAISGSLKWLKDKFTKK